MRHTITHNVGVVTGSDAAKLKLIVKSNVDSSRILTPTPHDIHYVKRFLFETSKWVNQRVGSRLAKVLADLHSDNP